MALVKLYVGRGEGEGLKEELMAHPYYFCWFIIYFLVEKNVNIIKQTKNKKLEKDHLKLLQLNYGKHWMECKKNTECKFTKFHQISPNFTKFQYIKL